MGLDVGTVRINYLPRPSGATYRFAWHLAKERDDDAWQVFTGENVFTEFEFDHLIVRAADYIASEGLDSVAAHQVMRWVRGLPWRDGYIMLHLGW